MYCNKIAIIAILANLNDRSLMGGRDSEIGVILEDEELLVWFLVI